LSCEYGVFGFIILLNAFLYANTSASRLSIPWDRGVIAARDMFWIFSCLSLAWWVIFSVKLIWICVRNSVCSSSCLLILFWTLAILLSLSRSLWRFLCISIIIRYLTFLNLFLLCSKISLSSIKVASSFNILLYIFWWIFSNISDIKAIIMFRSTMSNKNVHISQSIKVSMPDIPDGKSSVSKSPSPIL